MSTKSKPAPLRAICFGEILWDFLPDGIFPGGAPFNVAYHLHQLGVAVQVSSAVGKDLLGAEFMRRLEAWNVPTAGIARLARYPTGYVRAVVGPGGDARYEITPRVAWDQIPATPAMLRAAGKADAFIFGSLAQRSATNRASLKHLLAALPTRALRVFDVNLRPPYDDLPLVRQLSAQATVLKVNAAEAARLAGRKPRAGNEESLARLLAGDSGCDLIVITSGARGAGLLRFGKWYWEPGRRVDVVDTVGAGDSFLAAFVTHFLSGLDEKAILARACRLGEWVASQRGATPRYDHSTPR